MASITLSMEEYRDLEEKKIQAENSAADLQKQLLVAHATAIEQHVPGLLALVDEALTVVRFAVGNMPPESTRNWPIVSLQRVADLMPHLPGFGAKEQEIAIDFNHFAAECERFERWRAQPRLKSPTDSEPPAAA